MMIRFGQLIPPLNLSSIALAFCVLTTVGCGDDSSNSGLDPSPAPDQSTGVSGESTGIPSVAQSSADSTERSPILFSLMEPASTGIGFTYYGSPSPEHYMIEQNGGGVALADFDNDGNLDVFFANGSHFEKPARTAGATSRFYRSIGEWLFDDATEVSGLESYAFGMGVAAADYDNDGFVDLFMACHDRNRLWRNCGDGSFEEVTDEVGVGDERWGASAAFADLDGDGNLDLYVTNYVQWAGTEKPCYSTHDPPQQLSCSPDERLGQKDILYRNTGTGGFVDVSEDAGIALADRQSGKGLAIAILDSDGDGRLDIYVANDMTPNYLFSNLGNMRFEEIGVASGVAISSDGETGASMGVACADYNRDSRLDLAVTNFRNQIIDVYSNAGRSGFIPTNSEIGTDGITRSTLNFGIDFSDFDLDRWPDLYIANGHIWDLTAIGNAAPQMKPHLLRNRNGTRFYDVTEQSGSYFTQEWIARSVARGDIDNDGDIDMVITQMNDPAALLRNDSQRVFDSVSIAFVGVQSSRQALGATVSVTDSDGEETVVQIASGGSFQASHDPRVVVALPKTCTVQRVAIQWPTGKMEEWIAPSGESSLVLIEGTGTEF